MSKKNSDQRLRDRAQPEYTLAKGHNKRVRDIYPEAWAKSTITDRVLADWVKLQAKTCPYCSSTGPRFEIDHYQPLNQGGEHALENLRYVCFECNRSKGDKLPDEFLAYLRDNPREPEYRPDEAVLRPDGRFRTRSLFKEFSDQGLWSFEEFSCLYLKIADPTEYQVAQQLLGSWKHWNKLTRQKFLSGLIRTVREELRVKIRSTAAQRLLSSENVAALKMLATEEVNFLQPEPRKAVGRPSKVEEVFDETNEVNEDLKRIGFMN